MRPSFHFTSAAGWINDPHGIAVHEGAYHVFYQYVPKDVAWAPECSWGHAVGPDALSLTELAPILDPGDGDDGIWTGCLVPGDPARIFYTVADLTNMDMARVRVATADDGTWDAWTKGPVVAAPPPGVGVLAFRDPYVLPYAGGWLMIVGAGLAGDVGGVLAYRSADLERWEYDGVLLSHRAEGFGDMWECPQLLEIDGRAVLVFSIQVQHVGYDVRYAVGALTDGRFAATSWGVLTWGPGPYAPSAFTDADGRQCLTFWLRDIAGDGWAGAHSIPYLLSLEGDTLVAAPHPDVSRYAEPESSGVVPGAGIVSWSARDGESLRIGAGVELRSGRDLTIRVGAEEWRMPRGEDVRVVVDGPVLEVSSTAGVFAAPMDPGERLEVSGDGELAVCSLERRAGLSSSETPAAAR